jgi:hypothetical protein
MKRRDLKITGKAPTPRNPIAHAMLSNRRSGTYAQPPIKGKGSKYNRKGRDGRSGPSFLLTITA